MPCLGLPASHLPCQKYPQRPHQQVRGSWPSLGLWREEAHILCLVSVATQPGQLTHNGTPALPSSCRDESALGRWG